MAVQLSERVVRVEDLLTPDLDRADSLLGVNDDAQRSQYGAERTKGSLVPVSTAISQHPSELESRVGSEASVDNSQQLCVITETDSEKQLALVKQQPLPDGWPNISRLQEKPQSWDYYKLLSPSVNKAKSHLELLQNVIEEWVRETQSEMGSRAETWKSRRTAPGTRQQITFSSAAHGQESSTKLSVHGIGGHGGDTGSEPPHDVITDPYLPYLGADEVIDEVITLLAKIEKDRSDTVDALTAESERVTMLRSKIDTLAMKRLEDLPKAVQKEHEDCAMDISELNWHVSYRGRILDRNNNRVSVADTLNARLNKDIAHVNKHIPLVREKLDLEVDAMDRIHQAQVDTNEELDTTLQRCARVEAKSNDAHAKAEAERTSIKHDLDSVKNDLDRLTAELSQAKMTFNTYTHQCNDNRQQLTDNDQELKVLLVKDENIRAAQAIQKAKVQALDAEIKQREIECRTLEDENDRIQAKIDANKANFGKRESDLRGKIVKKTESLRQLTRQNDELTMDVDDLTTKSTDCDRQRIADEKNMERMAREMERTEEQINEAKDDLANVSIINNAVRDQLRKEEERCLQAEEALRSTTEGLKKQVKEEIHSRTVLVARIQTDGSDLVKAQEESKYKRDIIDKKVGEVNNAVQTILAKVEKLRTFHEEKSKQISKMNEEMQNVADIKKDIGITCDRKTQELRPKHAKHKEDLTKTEKKLDHIVWKTDMMTKKVKEMDESSVMMEKSVAKTTKLIIELEADLAELHIQIETGEKMEENLKTSLTQSNNRISDTAKQHEDHMRARNKVLDDHEKNLEYNIALNKQLAAQYRRLQNQYVGRKNKMLDQYEERVQLETAIKDLKQLKGLQLRMHSALMLYLRHRGLYNKAELERMDTQSHANAARVDTLQGAMDNALDKMTGFLKHQVDGDTIRRMAMAKVKEEEQREEELANEKTQKQELTRSRAPKKEFASAKAPVVPSIVVGSGHANASVSVA